MIGVELAGAVKNVVALACGMSDGLGYGDNARAALITRGLAEMARFGSGSGRRSQDLLGLGGPRGHGGHVYFAALPQPSRWGAARPGLHSRSSGAEIHMVAEGLTAAPVVLELARELGIDMPITEDVVRVIRGGKDVRPVDGPDESTLRARRTEADISVVRRLAGALYLLPRRDVA